MGGSRDRTGIILNTLVFVILLGSASLALGSPCVTDPATGAPLPEWSPGICTDGAWPVTRLVQLTEDGLLIVVVDAVKPASDAKGKASVVRHHNQIGLVVYCPPDLLDPVTGSPGPGCLADFDSLLTGPSALLGFATVQASIPTVKDAERCEASLHVLGDLRSADGGSFDIQSYLVRHETDDTLETADSADSAGGCGRFQGSMKISSVIVPTGTEPGSRSPEDVLEFVAGLDIEQAELLETLLLLDDGQLRMLEQLVDSVPDVVAADCDDPDDPDPPRSCIFQRVFGLPGKILEVLAQLGQGGPPGIQSAFNHVKVPDLLGIFQLLNQQISGLIAVAVELRMNFDDWAGTPTCGPGSDCEAFKGDLMLLIDGIEETHHMISMAPCLDGLARENRPLDTTTIRMMIQKAPPVLLFVLNKILDEVAPTMDKADTAVTGWRTMFQDLQGAFGVDIQAQLEMACEDPLSIIKGDPIACTLLRPEEIRVALNVVDNIARLGGFVAELLPMIWTKNDVNVDLVGVIGAGGGGGTNFPSPPKALLNVLNLLMKRVNIIIGRIQAKRASCLATDATIELDLVLCRPRFSYYASARTIPPWRRPTYEQAVDHVQRRVGEVTRCQNLWGGCMFLETEPAEQNLTIARAMPDSEEGFQYLCDALCEMRGTGPCNNVPRTCDPEANWKTHGQYVSCVARHCKKRVTEGTLTQEQCDIMVNEAARSNVGMP